MATSRIKTVVRADGKDLNLRYEMLKAERSSWEAVWQEQIDYFAPNRASITTKRQSGAKRTEKLFDSTALDSVNRLSAAMAGNLTPSSTKWFYLKMRNSDLNDVVIVKDWLEECAKRIRQAYNQSNFNAELCELYPDLIVFGTGCCIQDERPKTKAGKFGGLKFKTYGPGTYVIDEDEEGMVDTLFREFRLSARIAYELWGDSVKESLRMRQALESMTKKDARFPFLQCIYPREKFKEGPGTLSLDMKWASVYICLDDRKIVSEEGYPEFPGVVPRWSKSSDEMFGRGLGHIALPDVKTLNRAKELGLKAWAKEIDPPLLVKDAGVIGNVRTTPGGQTVITEENAIRPLETRARMDSTRFNVEMLMQSIRSIFFTDQLVMKSSPQMTAEEVRARMDLMYRVLGPTVMGRLERELLARSIERTFAIMMRADALPEPPQEVLDAYQNNEADIDIEYEGPLARSQRNVEIEAIERSIQRRVVLAQAGVQEAFDSLDISKATRLMDSIGGVPASVMHTEEEEQSEAESRAQMVAQQIAAQQQATGMATAKDAATAAKTASEVPQDDTMPMRGSADMGLPQ